tara:strand:+ start:1308 stop:1538 length:231 start_codon:yes stop_codon:yes gene_type:complete
MNLSKSMKTVMKMLENPKLKIIILVALIITLSYLLYKEKNNKCDCPVCEECDIKKNVTFAEKTSLIDTSQPIGPIA